MTDLTELWNKGKLPEGDYYIKRRNGLSPYDNIDSRGVWRNSIDEDIVEVLAPLPDYEEWQRLNWYAGEGVETITELKSSLQSAMELYQMENNNCKTLAQTLLKVSPEHKAWLEKNYKDYL